MRYGGVRGIDIVDCVVVDDNPGTAVWSSRAVATTTTAAVCVPVECVTPTTQSSSSASSSTPSASQMMTSAERWAHSTPVGAGVASAGSHVEMIYMEKQLARLCGQHAINNLLQGAYVTVNNLLGESKKLEQKFRKEVGVSPREVSDRRSDDSPYITEAGDFSIEVLHAVLTSRFGIALVPLAHPSFTDNVAANPTSAPSGAFVLHRHDHWYSLRRLHGRWWRLDSVKSRPIALSEFYVSAFLADAQQHDGYVVFVATGNFKPFSARLGLSGHGTETGWWTLYELERLEEQTRRRDKSERERERERESRLDAERQAAATAGGDTALQRALEDSKMQAILDESRRMAAGGSSASAASSTSALLAPVPLRRTLSAPSPRGGPPYPTTSTTTTTRSAFYADAAAVAGALSDAPATAAAMVRSRSAESTASLVHETWQNFGDVVETAIYVDALPPASAPSAVPPKKRGLLGRLFRRGGGGSTKESSSEG